MSDLNTPPAAELSRAEAESSADYFADMAALCEAQAELAEENCRELRSLRRLQTIRKSDSAVDALTAGALALSREAITHRTKAHTWRAMAHTAAKVPA